MNLAIRGIDSSPVLWNSREGLFLSFLVEKGIASRNTASKYLKQLEEIGVLEEEKVRGSFSNYFAWSKAALSFLS